MQKEKSLFKKIIIQKLEPGKITQGKKINIKKALAGQKNSMFYEQTCQANNNAYFSNGVFSAFLHAYNNHGVVKFTPDDIWLTILNYVSKIVNAHPEQLRDRFVSHKDKVTLEVTTKNERSQGQWDEFFQLMGPQIKKHTKEGIYDNFASCFSTTDRVASILSTATIMNGFKKYFDYGRCIPGCGITAVMMGGTLQDWKKLKQKLGFLKTLKYDTFDQYVQRNGAIIDQFIDTYNQKVDVAFWNSIVNQKQGRLGSGKTTYFSGWLTHLFGYYHPVQEVQVQKLQVDIKLTNKMTGQIKNLQLLGGSLAVNVEGNTFRPHYSVCIIEK